jgi:putative N6-adenine-specific DNA methylase
MMTGWKGETDFIDPMCGSGTLPIEAALIARNIAPGVFRKNYAFEKWADFDADLFDEIYNDDSKERDFQHHIYGYDIDFKAVNMATTNVKAAGLTADITIAQQDFKDFTGNANPAIIVTNPPYGERISTPNLLETYRMIGERLKHAFKEGEAWILSYREDCFQQIGLKASLKVPLYNGSLECEFRKYQLFSGKLKEFREEGGIVKTEEEKRKMAEKRRSWQKREYEKKQEEIIDNESADILSFNFTSLEKERAKRKAQMAKRDRSDRKDKFERKDWSDRKDSRKPFGKHFDGDDKGARKFKKFDSRAERQKDRKKFFGKGEE